MHTLFTLPAEPHVPGQNSRPDEAIFAAVKAAFGPDYVGQPEHSDPFRCGLVAFDAGYYWEAHELWEAVWLRLPPASRARHVMQGLIQLANAGLKHRMNRPDAAQKALARADYAIIEGLRGCEGLVMGLHANDIALRRDAVSAL